MLVSTHVTSMLVQGLAVDIFYMLPALDYGVLGDLLLSTTYSPTFDSGIECCYIWPIDSAVLHKNNVTWVNNPSVDKVLGCC